MPSRATRLARIDAGLCVYGCGSERDGSGLACTRCARHHAEREAQRRATLRRAGICIQCGQVQAAAPLFRCQACADRQAERMRRGDTQADMHYRDVVSGTVLR